MSDEHDPSHGYEAHAEEFATRRSPRIGVPEVTAWAEALPPPADVLDLGCGNGVPISQALMQAGCSVFGVDASPRMVAAFRARFPGVPVMCEPVEESALFGRQFDAAVSWGLMFLLPEQAQGEMIRRVSRALRPGGSFLFISPFQTLTWSDAVTGCPSLSLGAEAYRRLLAAEGLEVVREYRDEGDNYYYESRKL